MRYWETEFPNLSPSKNRAGNRIYTKEDISTIQEIQDLLYEQKFTIEGARRHFQQKKRGKYSSPEPDTTGHHSSPDSSAGQLSPVQHKSLLNLKVRVQELLDLVRSLKNKE